MISLNQMQNQMPGYRNAEYQLVLLPDQHLRDRILNLRRDFAAQYKLPYINPATHLTLARFNQIRMNEEKLVNRLKTIAMGFSPFKVEIKGFGSYPSHSIYMNVSSILPVQKLMKELKTAQRLMKSGDKEPHFLQEPHFFIARNLKPWQYEKGWKEYSHRSITTRFLADHLLLLKKTDTSQRLQVLERFEFLNLPVSVSQGDLFGQLA